jgi:hypothetical protein
MNVRYDVTTEDDECHVPNAESRTYSRSSYQVGGGRPPDVVEEVVRQEYNSSTNDQQIPLGRVTSNCERIFIDFLNLLFHKQLTSAKLPPCFDAYTAIQKKTTCG